MNSALASPIPLSPLGRLLQAGWTRLGELWQSQRKPRTLRVKETAALGERRIVAVVQVERQRFLIGASASSITLLAQLPDDRSAEGERA